jgi:TolB-like protein/Tfp pilus assembly protein PilF
LRADDRALVDAAASVADGAPVDWVSAESRADADSRRLVRHLRLVESIASLHRSIPPIEADDSHIQSAAADDRSRAPGPAVGEWGRLSLLERIGHGTSCEVYRAWDTGLHREVALKLLNDEGDHAEAHRRILEEARRLARIRHAHVVQVYGAEQHDNRVGLWMELVRGESLEQVVQARGPFGAREAALIGLDLCAALAAVHGAGLLHRDIKAQNVMRESGGRLVLMDFGTGEELSGTNRLVGTPLYLAPEIFRGQRASVQSDLYSLGVLLFYLATGKFPVVASSMEELARAHAHRQRQSLRDLRPDLPEAFVATVERALDSDPTRRYHSVGDFESALRDSLGVPAARAAVEKPAGVRRRFGFALSLAAAILVAVITGLIVWTAGKSGARPASIGSLAVLPLVDKSTSGSSELSDALTEQLIATIGQVDSLQATSITSTMRFKGSDLPRTEIAKQLGVDAVLDGAITVTEGSPDRRGSVRLDATLIEAGTGARLWSGFAVRQLGDSAALLSDVARSVTRAVRAQVTQDEALRLGQAKGTTPAAEEAYLQGRLHLAGYGKEAASRALKSFQRAIEADPGHAAAHASAAFAYVKLASFGGISHAEARMLARAEIRKAFENGDDIAEAHAAEADIRFLYDWDWVGAEAELKKSIDLNPSFMYARNVYAQLLAAEKRFDEMIVLSEESLRMDPQSLDALVNHGMLLYYKRDYAAAEQASRRALNMEPGNESALLLLARVLEAQGRYDEALTIATDTAKLAGDSGLNLRLVIIRLLALAGHRDDARAAAAALEKAGKDGTVRVHARDLGYLYVALGRTNDALDQFERALDERDPTLMWLTVAPRVDPLRSEPRFQAILRKIGLD